MKRKEVVELQDCLRRMDEIIIELKRHNLEAKAALLPYDFAEQVDKKLEELFDD